MIKSRTRWAEHVAPMIDRRGVDRGLVGRPKEERQPGRPRHKWEDNIKMYLQEVEWRNMGCNDLAQYRGRWRALVRAVMNKRIL